VIPPALGELEITATSVAVPGTAAPGIISPDDLFEHTRTDDAGRYRPLTGARTLPRGWLVPLGNGFSTEEAIETVYPLALTHMRQHARGALRIALLDDVLARQSGRYEPVAALSAAGRRLATKTLCGRCVRIPVWDGRPAKDDEIPCPEACSVLVALCREAVFWEASPPPTAPVDDSLPWAAFEVPGNEIREHYLQEMAAPNA
jgi:hypothetical protein